mmetsp:Transcript_45120/g.54240  ORF Transcript_45120/g.54240 Transcript_45120/m.54240 type:complete len:101 (+) Transcript_45120:1547-1849(+)
MVCQQLALLGCVASSAYSRHSTFTLATGNELKLNQTCDAAVQEYYLPSVPSCLLQSPVAAMHIILESSLIGIKERGVWTMYESHGKRMKQIADNNTRTTR